MFKPYLFFTFCQVLKQQINFVVDPLYLCDKIMSKISHNCSRAGKDADILILTMAMQYILVSKMFHYGT